MTAAGLPVDTALPVAPAADSAANDPPMATPLGPAALSALKAWDMPLAGLTAVLPWAILKSTTRIVLVLVVLTEGAVQLVELRLAWLPLASIGEVVSTPLKASIAPEVRPLDPKVQVKFAGSEAVATFR